jgi:hypothetical protein
VGRWQAGPVSGLFRLPQLLRGVGDMFMLDGQLSRIWGTGLDKLTAHGDNGGPNRLALALAAVDFLFSSEGDWE